MRVDRRGHITDRRRPAPCDSTGSRHPGRSGCRAKPARCRSCAPASTPRREVGVFNAPTRGAGLARLWERACPHARV